MQLNKETKSLRHSLPLNTHPLPSQSTWTSLTFTEYTQQMQQTLHTPIYPLFRKQHNIYTPPSLTEQLQHS